MFISILNRISLVSFLVVIMLGLSLWPGRVGAQTAGIEQIEGYWTGAFISEGVVQIVNAEIHRKGNNFHIEMELPTGATLT